MITRRYWLPYLALLIAAVSLSGCGGEDAEGQHHASDGSVRVEIAMLNHEPVQDVVREVDGILERRGPRVKVSRYDLETPKGEEFAEEHGLKGHVPLAIFIDGSLEHEIDGRTVSFRGFPRDRVPPGAPSEPPPGGDWTTNDLAAVVSKLTGGGR